MEGRCSAASLRTWGHLFTRQQGFQRTQCNGRKKTRQKEESAQRTRKIGLEVGSRGQPIGRPGSSCSE